MASQFPPLIVMGVSGSGKSTMGAALGRELGMQFIDGDDLHPDANKVKMAAGHALNDQDRTPWLDIIGYRISTELVGGSPIIVACSALKRSYRQTLTSRAPSTVFVYLHGDRALIAERQSHRIHEYMPNSLLNSQFTSLEPLSSDERGIRVNLEQTPDEIIRSIRNELTENFVNGAAHDALQ